VSFPDFLAAAAVILYAAFFAWVGYVIGVRRTTRKHMPALLLAAKKPTPAHLGNTVARQPQRPADEG
jgi:hypothetical protein